MTESRESTDSTGVSHRLQPRAVRKAVIPAAGFGTRMHPFSWLIPKELVPLGNVPALHWVLDEVTKAGLSEVAIVVRSGKPMLQEHLTRAQDEGLFPELDIQWVIQPRPLGLGDAIMVCRDFVDDQPFALLWPDNVFLSPDHDLGHAVALFEATRLDVLGVVELDHSDSEAFGRSGLFESTEEVPWSGAKRVRLTRLLDKRPGRLGDLSWRARLSYLRTNHRKPRPNRRDRKGSFLNGRRD